MPIRMTTAGTLRIVTDKTVLTGSKVPAVGLVLGLVICLLQEHFGLLKLGNGSDYVLSAYPVEVQAPDVLIVALIVLAIGYLSAYIPTRQIVKKA